MNQTMIEIAAKEENWHAFLQYKLDRQHLSCQEEKELRDFIERKDYLPICELWKQHKYPASLPVKKTINKMGTRKKRIVYTFPGDEGIFLKFIAFHLFRYDSLFCHNCYAFRREFGVQNAIRRIRSTSGLGEKYCLKVDISNYFNSIDVNILISQLAFLKEKDFDLFFLFSNILGNEYVIENGRIISEVHGAMAGTPISPFFANIYFRSVDFYFEQRKVPYFRYSDDILLFADNLEALTALQTELYQKIADLKLTINPDKVHISAPGEVWEFLGFCYRNGDIDLSDTTIRKTKAKIKRKADALRRWQRNKGLSGEKAAIGLIRAMNRKFFGNSSYVEDKNSALTDKNSALADKNLALADDVDTSEHNIKDFTWSRWFFPNLTVDTGLRTIDAYLQEYIRYTVTGRHYKGNYRIRYDTLKKWGYRSLVHEYYKDCKQ